MLLKQITEVCDLLDTPDISGDKVKKFLKNKGLKDSEIEVVKIEGKKGCTDLIKIKIGGTNGKSKSLKSPTLGIIGRVGGLGARPEKIGLVSDADGAIIAISCAYKIVEMRERKDFLLGDIIISTHICPNAPTIQHELVKFMDSPVDIHVLLKHEVDAEMDAILSNDTTRGNRIINHRGFSISPTVKDGYILRVSEDLLDIMQNVTGKPPVVLPITMQDITPYGNNIYHLNSIMQPSTVTSAPVVGVAITSELPIAGCSTGVTQIIDIEMAARFNIEVAKAFGKGNCKFYNEKEFEEILKRYGPSMLSHKYFRMK
ncbi:MAG: DUF1177 domain-containing protein [Acidobacteriota bacterium]